MAGDEKKKSAQKDPPKEKAPPKEKTTTVEKDTPAEAPVEAMTGAKAEGPKSYSRGEGQKPVSQAYKDNWDAIYGKKKKKKR